MKIMNGGAEVQIREGQVIGMVVVVAYSGITLANQSTTEHSNTSVVLLRSYKIIRIGWVY